MRRLSLLLACLMLAFTVSCGNDSSDTNTSPQSQGGSAGVSSSASSGVCASVGTRKFAKTRFLANAGVAYGAFSRYIYKPYRDGAFKKDAPGRTKALVKAGASALVVADQLRRAKANAASDPTLCKLGGPLEKAAALVGGIAPALKDGSFNPTDLLGADQLLKQIGSDSASSGATIKEK